MSDRPRAVVLVAWRPGNPWRNENWLHVEAFWRRSTYPIFAAGAAQTGTFNRGAARNEAARNAGDWDVAILADADTLPEIEFVSAAVELAASEQRAVLPYRHFVRLRPRETQDVTRREGPLPRRITEWPPQPPVGGCLIVPRRLWDETNGYDERFLTWGYEDTALWAALGGASRVDGFLWHLWHPVEPASAILHPSRLRNRDLAMEYGIDPQTGTVPGLPR